VQPFDKLRANGIVYVARVCSRSLARPISALHNQNRADPARRAASATARPQLLARSAKRSEDVPAEAGTQQKLQLILSRNSKPFRAYQKS
jgi:hypothetical protein